MSDVTTVVVSLSQRLGELQKRLEALESEKIAVKQEIATLLDQIARTVPPPLGDGTRSQVLWVLRSDEDHAHSPLDICTKLGRSHESDLNSVRLLLGRLHKEGVVKRIRHGRYQINKER